MEAVMMSLYFTIGIVVCYSSFCLAGRRTASPSSAKAQTKPSVMPSTTALLFFEPFVGALHQIVDLQPRRRNKFEKVIQKYFLPTFFS